MRVLTNAQIIDGLTRDNGCHDAAAEALHAKYSRRIIRWVWRLLGNDSEHDDVVQQVFLNIIKNLTTIKNVDALDSWIDSVTIITVRDEIRKRKRRWPRVFKLEPIDPDELRDGHAPFREGHIRAFYKIVSEMSPDNRIIFILRYLEGYRVEEIAAISGYSLSTAKRRLTEAKAHFIQNVLKDFSLMTLVEGRYAD